MKKVKGFVLIFTLFIIGLVTLVASTFFISAYNEFAAAETASNNMRAYYIAEAGLAKKFMDLRSGNINPLSENFTILAGISGSYSVTVTLVGGGVMPTYRLDSAGYYKTTTKAVSLTLKQISCARYAYLTNSERRSGNRIWFITNDYMRGPLHSNDQLNISGNPTFDGCVSSSDSSINYYHGGPPNDNPDFRESLTLGAPEIELPKLAEIMGNIRDAAMEDDLHLTGNTSIVLLSNGTMNVTNNPRGWTNYNIPIPPNGAVYVSNGYVDVSGTLKGQLTIGTNNEIYITNNILYQTDPRTDPTSTDLLGLVAQNNVIVSSSAPYNLEIDGYIVALNSSFTVENYWSGLKGVLTVFGGITQERRGPVSTFNPATNQKVSGYTKDYNYDERLEDVAPLHFPPARDVDNRVIYRKVKWSEH